MEGDGFSKRSGKARWWIAGGAACAALAAGLTLFWYNPAEVAFYPRCIFHSLTGLDCPGCGGLRAAHQLLHGNVRAAFGYNPLLVCLLPLGSWFLLATVVGRFTTRKAPPRLRNPNWVWLLGGVVILFAVLRNIPLQLWWRV